MWLLKDSCNMNCFCKRPFNLSANMMEKILMMKWFSEFPKIEPTSQWIMPNGECNSYLLPVVSWDCIVREWEQHSLFLVFGPADRWNSAQLLGQFSVIPGLHRIGRQECAPCTHVQPQAMAKCHAEEMYHPLWVVWKRRADRVSRMSLMSCCWEKEGIFELGL